TVPLFELQATVGLTLRQHVLDVENHDVWTTERPNPGPAEVDELAVRDSHDDRIIASARRLRDHGDSVLAQRLRRIYPRIMHIHGGAEAFELPHDVDHFGVAHVRAVLFERQPKTQHSCAGGLDVALDHELDHSRRNVLRHTVVQTAAGQD